jgi:signal transduction histidine kinase
MVAVTRSPTIRLLTGLAVTLSAVAVYSGYTLWQLHDLRRVQTETIDRDRTDSLLLLRVQNNLNSLALAMRDMVDASESYPLIAWKSQFTRMQNDLTDALAREEALSLANPDQRRYLTTFAAQFWDAADRIFRMAESGQEEEARTQVRLSLQSRQEALSSAVARLLVQNNESEQQAAAQTREIYARAERNAYLFLAAMMALLAATGLYLVHGNRAMFAQVAELSERRSELARQLISTQENAFRHISRELHDEFGQILTAIGAMLNRAARKNQSLDPGLRAELEEVREIVQSTLDKVRALSKALHSVVLDDAGLEGALNVYLPGFERRTGVEVRYERDGETQPMESEVVVHLYRILQEALNNVALHSKSARATVRLHFQQNAVVLEVQDEGVGFKGSTHHRGMGLTSMRERAELLNGRIEFLEHGGALVRLTVPLESREAHAGA